MHQMEYIVYTIITQITCLQCNDMSPKLSKIHTVELAPFCPYHVLLRSQVQEIYHFSLVNLKVFKNLEIACYSPWIL